MRGPAGPTRIESSGRGRKRRQGPRRATEREGVRTMARQKTLQTLRIGMIGAGFIARFHLESFTGVRNCAITGVYSPSAASRNALAARADELGLGPCTAHRSLGALIRAKDVDALWILSPNDTRVATMQAIHKAVKERQEAARHCLREAARAQSEAEARAMVSLRGGRQARHRLSGEPGVLDGGCSAGRRSSGAAQCRSPAGPISRVRPRSIPVRTCPGSGKGEKQGGRRAVRHDVPLGGGGAPHADGAG